MQAGRAFLTALWVFVVFGSVSFTPLAQQNLPPLLHTCPMHPDVLEEHPGDCKICKMKLEPVRIEPEFWYACAARPAVLSQKPGTCPFDKRPMVRVVVTVHWVCRQNPDQTLMEPGKCADSSAREEKHVVRAHGDHNPRHGGQFYMATDSWHHVEGTYPRAGLFRAYFYDNFTQPIDVKGFTGRVLIDQTEYLMKPGRGNTLEAALKGDRVPFKLALKVKFNHETPENHFDFFFDKISIEPPAVPAPVATTAAARSAAPVQPMPMPTPAAPTATAAPPLTNCESNLARTDVLLLSDALPNNSKALLDLLTMCSAEVQKLIEGGQFGFVYQPTILGKDIALALEDHVRELPEARRAQASDSIRRTVLSAWQLDLYGDLGNQEKLSTAFELFAAAIADLKSAYAAQR